MIEERILHLKDQFQRLSDWEQRYSYLINLGKKLENYPEEFRQDSFKVKGCQSQLWLYPKWQDDKIHFFADSDASIVKGLVALLLFVYNDLSPTEILSLRPTFLEELGLRENLSMSRGNGLNSLLKQLSLYALVFQSQQQK